MFGEHARQIGFPAMYAARLKANRGDIEAAADSYELALNVFRGDPRSSHSNRPLRLEYAEVMIALGKTAGASALLDEAEAAFKVANDIATQRGTWLRTARGELACAQGDKANGDAWFERVLHDVLKSKEPPGSFVPRFAAAVARAHPERERAQSVLTLLRKDALLPAQPGDPDVDFEDKARLDFAIGRLYLAVGRNDDAQDWLERAVALREPSDVPTSPWLAEATVALAEARR